MTERSETGRSGGADHTRADAVEGRQGRTGGLVMAQAILINAFEVPAGHDEFLEGRNEGKRLMERRPGYVSTTLHRGSSRTLGSGTSMSPSGTVPRPFRLRSQAPSSPPTARAYASLTTRRYTSLSTPTRETEPEQVGMPPARSRRRRIMTEGRVRLAGRAFEANRARPLSIAPARRRPG